MTVAQWVVLTTLFTTLFSIAATLAVIVAFETKFDPAFFATAVAVPLVMTPLIAGYFALRQQQLRQLNLKLNDLAYRDYLLGCLNRRAFTESADQILRRASKQAPCGLLVIDADNFKSVNDTYGHDVGDEALTAIMNAIKGTVRETDIIGRLGGEEFGVLLTRANPEHLPFVAERIRQAVASVNFEPRGTTHSLSVSIGGAIATNSTDFARVFGLADARLYDAKNQGRNTIEVPDHELLDYSRKIA